MKLQEIKQTVIVTSEGYAHPYFAYGRNAREYTITLPGYTLDTVEVGPQPQGWIVEIRTNIFGLVACFYFDELKTAKKAVVDIEAGRFNPSLAKHILRGRVCFECKGPTVPDEPRCLRCGCVKPWLSQQQARKLEQEMQVIKPQVFMEIRHQGEAEIWSEEVNLKVPAVSEDGKHRDTLEFTDWADAAKATMDFWNATLNPHDKPRQITRVYTFTSDGVQADMWRGCYPEAKIQEAGE